MSYFSKITFQIRTHFLRIISILILSILIINIIVMCILITSLHDYSESYSQITEPSYAGEITEGILIARNQNDFEKYISYRFPDYQKFVTKQMFESSVGFVRLYWGDYIPNSKMLRNAWLHKTHGMRFIKVFYYAKFTNNPNDNIPIMIEFEEIEGKPYVQGDNYNISASYH